MNGGRLFRRPKLNLSCSAGGKEGRKLFYYWQIKRNYFKMISI
jgi:hypothetical protein